MDRIRVLFLHGIDAQPRQQWPAKSQMLASIWGVSVRCPDLGSADWMQRMWALVIVNVVLCGCALGLLAWAVVGRHLTWQHALGIAGAVLAVGCGLGHWAKRHCLRSAYTQALAVAAKEVRDFEPHVVVGQSFGAVVAMALDDPVPLLLLASAHKIFCGHAGLSQPGCSSRSVLLVHGTEDWMAPISDARELHASLKVESQLLEIEGGDHQLRTITPSEMCEFVHQLYAHLDTEGGRERSPGFVSDDDDDECAPLLDA